MKVNELVEVLRKFSVDMPIGWPEKTLTDGIIDITLQLKKDSCGRSHIELGEPAGKPHKDNMAELASHDWSQPLPSRRYKINREFIGEIERISGGENLEVKHFRYPEADISVRECSCNWEGDFVYSAIVLSPRGHL